MTKKELREKYKIIRDDIKDKKRQNDEIFLNITSDFEFNQGINDYLLYASFSSEVDTYKLIKYYLSFKNVYLPRTQNNEMQFYQIHSLNDLELGEYGILCPKGNEIISDLSHASILVPGICFDECGYRIGYGKGYYDRFLEGKDIVKVGTSFYECIINSIPHEEHDICLDKVITSNKKC